MTEGPPLVPEEPDERDTYANEAISYLRNRGNLYSDHDVRLNPAPRWYFARDDLNVMHYRRVNPEHEIGGFPTENWWFIHHSGEKACGEEPLEFFSDWEGSEASDMQEPTPFGWQLLRANKLWPVGTGWQEELEREYNLEQKGVQDRFTTSYVEEEDPIAPESGQKLVEDIGDASDEDSWY
ncbi:hypothetical protein F5X68DRAFT_195403 [Plectosphaerella plurivora]|uniref:Uncharacterized protein n=1 Tax=Plectosphaerella plurivora TaxID=936078 RepID=A0A9P9A582_9PEZI|nr:hypothetical protein F5X68DRAFT_195403 [Plectosphaerella plurivora]